MNTATRRRRGSPARNVSVKPPGGCFPRAERCACGGGGATMSRPWRCERATGISRRASRPAPPPGARAGAGRDRDGATAPERARGGAARVAAELVRVRAPLPCADEVDVAARWWGVPCERPRVWRGSLLTASPMPAASPSRTARTPAGSASPSAAWTQHPFAARSPLLRDRR